jgi:hypothetical protein
MKTVQARLVRRVIALGAAIGLLGAISPSIASANSGDNLVIGSFNYACHITDCPSGYTRLTALIGYALNGHFVFEVTDGENGSDGGPGFAIEGTSNIGTAVYGLSHGGWAAVNGTNDGSGDGVYGESRNINRSGVYAYNTAGGWGLVGRTGGVNHEGVWGDNLGTGHGVKGTTGDVNAAGVFGLNSGNGSGVWGRAVNGGTGVYGENFQTGNGVRGYSAGGDGVQGTSGNANRSGIYAVNIAGGYGLVGRTTSANHPAVWGDNQGTNDGVLGTSVGSAHSGVAGTNNGGGNGVYGHANNSAASGVYGQNDGTGYGVAGRALIGTGILGDSANGTGVWANSQNATALKVSGKAQFSRSGVATVAGTSTTPSKSVRVTLPITAKSMMTATLQKYVPGVFVVAAVPNVTGGYFTIYLNKSVTTSVGPISWMVVERP